MLKSFCQNTEPKQKVTKKNRENVTYEQGAHFKYSDLQRRLLELIESLPLDRLGNEGIYFQDDNDNDDNTTGIKAKPNILLNSNSTRKKGLYINNPLSFRTKPNVFTPIKTVKFYSKEQMKSLPKLTYSTTLNNEEETYGNISNYKTNIGNRTLLKSIDKPLCLVNLKKLPKIKPYILTAENIAKKQFDMDKLPNVSSKKILIGKKNDINKELMQSKSGSGGFKIPKKKLDFFRLPKNNTTQERKEFNISKKNSKLKFPLNIIPS